MKNLILLALVVMVTIPLFAQNNCREFDGDDDYITATRPAIFSHSRIVLGNTIV